MLPVSLSSLLASLRGQHLLSLLWGQGIRMLVLPLGTATLYDRYLSGAFREANPGEFTTDPRKLDLNYADLLPSDKSAAILDAGCGMGHFLHYLGQKGFTNLLGIDLSSEAIAFCRDRVSARVELVPGIEEFLRSRKDTFDLIILKDVIEHLRGESVLPTLDAIHKALKPGGTLLIETGNMASFTGTYLLYNDFTHQGGFTETSLKQVLRAAGYGRISVRGSHRRESVKDRLSHALWRRTLRWIYRAERGKSGVPAILEKLLIASATKEL